MGLLAKKKLTLHANIKGTDQPAQSDQRLCYMLSDKYYDPTCCNQNFNILASLRSWADWFESHLVRNPKEVFSCDKDRMLCVLLFVSGCVQELRQWQRRVYFSCRVRGYCRKLSFHWFLLCVRRWSVSAIWGMSQKYIYIFFSHQGLILYIKWPLSTSQPALRL